MKYTQIPSTTFQNLQMNAGILLSSFDPSTGTVNASNIIGATTGGVSFTATPEYADFGEDVDNCPKNTKEMKKLTNWDVKLTGNFVSVTANLAKKLVGAGDLDSIKITPRRDILASDFGDVWWVGDYSDVNTGDDAGFCAIHVINGLSTGGFQIQSTDKGKGQFAFEFTGHFSMSAQDTVPFEVYVKSGEESALGFVELNTHAIQIKKDATYQLSATTFPAGSTVTWSSSSNTYATVSSGLVTGAAVGTAIITASITDTNSITYTDTCTVVVVAAS